jgi:hypothetical protein
MDRGKPRPRGTLKAVKTRDPKLERGLENRCPQGLVGSSPTPSAQFGMSRKGWTDVFYCETKSSFTNALSTFLDIPRAQEMAHRSKDRSRDHLAERSNDWMSATGPRWASLSGFQIALKLLI